MSIRDPRHYRADIDGLRAVAVLSVIAFHAFPSHVPGGFLGVDVFFVISGYLISGILLRNLERGTFSFADFYARRVRRIFPALSLVLVACFVLGYRVLPLVDFRALGRNLAGGALFASNLVQLDQPGYFSPQAQNDPLLHLWSLGIEEQFYVLWPLLLFFLGRSRRRAVALIAVCGLASFAANLLQVDDVVRFYSPVNRFWELLAGSSLAAISPTATEGVRRRWRLVSLAPLASPNARAALGFALIVGSVLALREGTAFAGVRGLFPVAGAALLIAAGPGAWINRNILARRAFVWVGTISYPLYLWHWPLLAFPRVMVATPASLPLRLALITAAFVLAWLTYRLVEEHLRTSSRPAATRGLVAAIAVMGCCGAVTVNRNGFPHRFPAAISEYADFDTKDPSLYRYNRCLLVSRTQTADALAPECVDAGFGDRPRSVLLYGDSHAAHLYPGLSALREEHHLTIAQITHTECHVYETSASAKTCAGMFAYALDFVRRTKPDYLVYAKRYQWTGEIDASANEIAELRAAGAKHVIFVGPVPEWTLRLPRTLVSYYLYESQGEIPSRMSYGLRSGRVFLDDYARRAAERLGVTYFSPSRYLCEGDECITRFGEGMDQVEAFDATHFTPVTSKFVAGHLLEAMGLGNETARL